ncbi:MAG: hypothetical protein ACLP0J_14050 [Solirubrobacteraceae bacterium]
MKVWARYAVPVMVLVDEHKDEIERVVMVPDERFIDRETMGDMLFYTEQLKRISSSQQQAAHALYVADYDQWPDPAEWEIEDSWDMLSMSVDEQLHPSCPDCDGEGYMWPEDAGDEDDGDPCPRCAANGFIDRDLGRHPDAPVADAH